MLPKENRLNQPHLIGKAFENYALEILFPREHFDLLERVPEFTSNKKHFALNALNPDFKFKEKKTGIKRFNIPANSVVSSEMLRSL